MNAAETDLLVTDVNAWRGSDRSWDDLHRSFQIHVPERFNMAVAAVGRHAVSERADHIALIDASGPCVRKLSFAQLDEQSDRLAQFLLTLGVRRGDVVIAYLALAPVAWVWSTRYRRAHHLRGSLVHQESL